MDKYIFDKYLNDETPFYGLNIHCSENIPLNDLRVLLQLVVDYLNSSNLIETEMYKVWDWFQHDGYLPKKEVIKSRFLKESLKSTDALYSIRSGETYVNLGLLDKYERWYLRVYIIDDYDLDGDEERNGTFDISMCKNQAKDLVDYIHKRSTYSLISEETKSYLSKIYAG